MTVCKKCGGSGWDDEHMIKCLHCYGSGEVEQTNEEYLRSLNTEQLAEWFYTNFDTCDSGCSKCVIRYQCYKSGAKGTAKDFFMEWLKEKHD